MGGNCAKTTVARMIVRIHQDNENQLLRLYSAISQVTKTNCNRSIQVVPRDGTRLAHSAKSYAPIEKEADG